MKSKRSNAPGGARPFGDQLEALLEAKGLMKMEAADRAGINPTQLAHYLKHGCSMAMVERIARALDTNPAYFDVYVAGTSEAVILENAELLEFMRALHGASVAKRKALLKRLKAQ
jgi:transcriptional regulator with XRE-family HTH domain